MRRTKLFLALTLAALACMGCGEADSDSDPSLPTSDGASAEQPSREATESSTATNGTAAHDPEHPTDVTTMAPHRETGSPMAGAETDTTGQGTNTEISPSGDDVSAQMGMAGRCDMLVETQGMPAAYPPVYRQPEGAAALSEEQINEFRAAYELTEDDYLIEGSPITWAPRIRRQVGDAIVLSSGTEEMTADMAHDLVWPFLERWSALIKLGDVYLDEQGWCNNGPNNFATCTVTYRQTYCGMDIAFDGLGRYSGQLQVQLERRNSDDINLRDLTSSLIPPHQVYVNPLLDPDAATQSIIGTQHTFTCGQETTMTFTDDLAYEVAADPVLFIRLADDEASLEYRTAYQVSVGVEWTIWVDAFDGSVLRIAEQFDC